MPNRLALAFALSLATSPAVALAEQGPPADLDQRVHCAAVFAALARDQATGQAGADAYPVMEGSGKAFFVATGVQLISARQLDEAAVRTIIKDEVGKFQREVIEAKDPKAHFDAAFKACSHYLAEVAADPAAQAQH